MVVEKRNRKKVLLQGFVPILMGILLIEKSLVFDHKFRPVKRYILQRSLLLLPTLFGALTASFLLDSSWFPEIPSKSCWRNRQRCGQRRTASESGSRSALDASIS